MKTNDLNSSRSILSSAIYFFLVMWCLQLVVHVGFLSAADLHVGSGQTYTTIASAITASSNGDTVYIHEGTYNETGLTPKTNTTLTGVDGENRPIIDAQSSSYNSTWGYEAITIIYDDITLNYLDVRDGPRGTIVLEDTSIDNFTLTNCTLSRSGGPVAGDNSGILYVKPIASNLTIMNNSFTTSANGYSAIILFQPEGGSLNISNNNFSVNSGGSAVFIKHAGDATGRAQIKNNYIRMNASGYDSTGLFLSHDNVDVRNNIIYGDGLYGIWIGLDAGGCGGSGTAILHNTIYMPVVDRAAINISRDCSPTNIEIKNNIIYKGNNTSEYRTLTAWIYGIEQEMSENYNLFYQAGITEIIKNPILHTLESFRAVTGNGLNSILEEPMFAGSGSSILDFEVVGGAANNAASDGTDMGADVTMVGAGQFQPASEVPGAVQDFRFTSGGTPSSLLNECAEYISLHPEWIFCDDFESDSIMVGDGRYFEYNDDGGNFVRQSGVGVEGSVAMRVLWQEGETDAGSLLLGFGRNPSDYMNKYIKSDQDFKEIYYRMYLKNEANWQGSPYKLSRASVIARDDWSQAMIAHVWTEGVSDELISDPASCVHGDIVECSGMNDFAHLQWLGKTNGSSPVFSSGYTDKWICIEVHVKLNDPGLENGVHEFWVDGQLEASRNDLNFVGSYTDYGINYLSFENYWNDGSVKEQSRYFDNIVVSTSPIGC